GSSMRKTLRAPADSPASCTALRSTGVALAGTQIMMRGPVKPLRRLTRRMNGLDLARRASEHALGFVADGDDPALATSLSHGDDGGFVENDATSRHVNQRVRCT